MTPRARSLITELMRLAADCDKRDTCKDCMFAIDKDGDGGCTWESAVGGQPDEWQFGRMLLGDNDLHVMAAFGATRARRIAGNSVTLSKNGDLLARVDLTDSTDLFKTLALNEEVNI